MMKKTLWLVTLMFSGFVNAASAAGDKVCYPTSGSPVVQSYSISKTLSAEDNQPNSLLLNNYAISTGQSITFTCNCDSPSENVSHWWSSATNYPVTQDGNYSWQQLTPYLAASVEIYIYNSTGGERNANYHTIPFIGVTNNTVQSCSMNGNAASGSQGTVSLKIIKPAVGHIAFNGIVAKLWHYRKPNYINQADPPEGIVNLNLNFDVPNGCTLLPGSTMNVDLGTNIQTDFTGRIYPESPKSYTPKTFELQFDCDFSSDALDVVLNGVIDSQGMGFATSNPDVSVIITDDKGTIIKPNQFAGIVTVGDTTTSTRLILKAYPSNAGSSGVPTPGFYDATVTILLSYD